MFARLSSKITDLAQGLAYFHKTSNGEYIIPIGEDYGLYNVLVYVNDDYVTPKISKVIKLNEDKNGYIEELWRDILNDKITERRLRTTISFIEEYVGEGHIIEYNWRNRTPFQTYDEGRSGNERTENGGEIGDRDQSTFKRYDIRRTADTESDGDTKENTAADLKRSAFSLPDNNTKYSITETESALKTENEKLKADNKTEHRISNFAKIS